MKPLYELNEDYIQLFHMLLEASEGESPLESLQGLEEALAIENAEFEGKASAYAFMIRKLENEESFLKSESKYLADKAKRKALAIEKLKQNLHNALELRSIKKIDLGQYVLSFRKSEAVEIDEPGNVPDCYIRSEIVSKIDKISIKQALKQGELVQGARLVEKNNLQIK